MPRFSIMQITINVPTYLEVASSYDLWEAYMNPIAASRAEFYEHPLESRVEMIAIRFGVECKDALIRMYSHQILGCCNG